MKTLVCCAIAMGCAARTVDWSAPPKVGAPAALAPPRANELRLANGIRVIVVENHRLPVVAINVVHASAGGREDRGNPGLAALTADLLDEGAGSRNAAELAEALERAASRLDIYVASDYASMQLVTTAEHVEPAISLLADMIRRPLFADTDVARVRERRLGAIAERATRSRTLAAQLFDRMVFGSHPYAFPAEGTAAGLSMAPATVVRDFWQRTYRPDDMTLIIAGDVELGALRRTVERAFADWPTPAPVPVRASSGAHPGQARRGPDARVSRNLGYIDVPGAEQSVVLIGSEAVSVDDPQRLARDVANSILGGGIGSRLDRELHDKQGIALAASTSFWRGRLGGTWSMTATVRTDATAHAIRTALAIIDGTRKGGVTAGELARAKTNLTRSLAQAFDTMAGTARAYERLVVQELPPSWYAGYARALAAIDERAVRAAANSTWSDLSIVVVGDWAKIGGELAALGLPVRKYERDGTPAR